MESEWVMVGKNNIMVGEIGFKKSEQWVHSKQWIVIYEGDIPKFIFQCFKKQSFLLVQNAAC